MKIDIMTLFPETMNAVLHESIIGRAAKKGIVEINCVQIRDYTDNKQNQVDDYPYGGGWGCVMMAQPLKACLDHIMEGSGGLRTRVIYMSPQGSPYNEETAKRLQRDYDHLVLVCGHYEGIDERFIEACVDEEISLGDFVLTGGEIAAMAVADSVCRLVPGVLADEECYTEESHWDGLLEYPQYTRPEEWEGRRVPEVLLGGNHAEIMAWRRKQEFARTKEKRPDLFARLELTDKEDLRLLAELEKDEKRLKLTQPLSYRKTEAADLDWIVAIVQQARALLKRFGVDQWQGEYPAREDFAADMEKGESYVVLHGDEIAGMFSLTTAEQPNYDAITDGKFTPNLPYAVLHRCSISEKYRGTGMSSYMCRCAEELVLAMGRHCIRTDTHRKNKGMKKLLAANGYRFCGNVLIDEQIHDPRRQAFEKILKEK